jgi:CRISPR-associated endonuclease/helicase Cas3
METYWAHIDQENRDRKQSVETHNEETAHLARWYCSLPELKEMAWLAGFYHDIGKMSSKFKTYLKQASEHPGSVVRGSVDHSTAGGRLLRRDLAYADGKSIQESGEDVKRQKHYLNKVAMMECLAIYMHHGLQDSVNFESGESLCQIRGKAEKEEIRETELLWEGRLVAEDIVDEYQIISLDLEKLERKISDFVSANTKCGKPSFYWGMYERLLLSLLIEGDRISTACFASKQAIPDTSILRNRNPVWKDCQIKLELYLDSFEVETDIQKSRKEISDTCRKKAENLKSLYRLTVPTGSGKTLAGLRFALYHADKYQKERIIYVAPYCSILEQNAQVFREVIQDPNLLLEHHSNVIIEEDEGEYNHLLSENWDCPFLVTTAVQFLDTLFGGTMANVRRMHSLCNSVIIIDEVQSIPIKCIMLFNLAMNFLSQFAGCTVLLCSATQPIFDQLKDNKLKVPEELVDNLMQYEQRFRRVEIVDKTRQSPSGISVAELGQSIRDILEKENSVLTIVNTKYCARKTYEYIKEHYGEELSIYHLSTNMCAQHRRDKLAQMKAELEELNKNSHVKKKVICISTQLIEAGVDISFDCVIRSLTGLDSLLQAAGRCNRHGGIDKKFVYLVKMNKEAENLDHLKDIRMAQQAMERTLEQIQGKDLLSPEIRERYYQNYYYERQEEMYYLTKSNDNLVELLSDNCEHGEKTRKREGAFRGRFIMEQAFDTAGKEFHVIPEDSRVDVVIEYKKNLSDPTSSCAILPVLDKLREGKLSLTEYKREIRKLQRFTVGISNSMYEKLKSIVDIITLRDGKDKLMIWPIDYYDENLGIVEAFQGITYFC